MESIKILDIIHFILSKNFFHFHSKYTVCVCFGENLSNELPKHNIMLCGLCVCVPSFFTRHDGGTEDTPGGEGDYRCSP